MVTAMKNMMEPMPGPGEGPLRDPRIEPIWKLSSHPFRGSAAVHSGLLTEHDLRTRYRRLYRNIYLDNDIELTARLRAEAAWMSAGPDAVLVGSSAAAVYGARWLDADAPAEIVRTDRRATSGLRVRSYHLAPEDIQFSGGMRLTTPARTALDIGRLTPQAQAVPMLDALMHATELDRHAIWALADRHRGMRGIRAAKLSVALADGGARSPLQSQVRLALSSLCEWPIETQIPFYDDWGLVFTRVAMGWPRLKLAVECDEPTGDADAEYRTWMLRHTETLEQLGWVVAWVTEPMMRNPTGVAKYVLSKVLAARRRQRR
jgi:hypothetical protein